MKSILKFSIWDVVLLTLDNYDTSLLVYELSAIMPKIKEIPSTCFINTFEMLITKLKYVENKIDGCMIGTCKRIWKRFVNSHSSPSVSSYESWLIRYDLNLITKCCLLPYLASDPTREFKKMGVISIADWSYSEYMNVHSPVEWPFYFIFIVTRVLVYYLYTLYVCLRDVIVCD